MLVDDFVATHVVCLVANLGIYFDFRACPVLILVRSGDLVTARYGSGDPNERRVLTNFLWLI
jgi:hypothetical protein